MRALSFAHAEAVEQLQRQLGEFVAAAVSLTERQLVGHSRCDGWSVLDVVVHVRLGLEEMVVGSTRLEAVPDHDAASYWTGHADDRDDDPVPHVLWLRRVAGAYGRPGAAVRHLADVARQVTAAVAAMPEGTVGFQGQRLLSGDFLATWVVELAVHQLDLGRDDDRSCGLAWTRLTLEALAGEALPAGLDDRGAVLVGLGRVAPPPDVRLAASYPVSL